jgi:nucleoside-diphosphate-sugar epimerase
LEIELGKAPILLVRDLELKRDFISARDCVRALRYMTESEEPGSIYNVASGNSTSIAKIVGVFLDLAWVWPIEVRTYPSDEERSSVREHRVSDARRLTLRWKPQETVCQTIGYQLDTERNRS